MPKRAPLTSTIVPPISGTFEYAVRAMLRPQFLIRTCPLERRALSERPRVLGHGEWVPGRPIDIATKLKAVYEHLQVMEADPTLAAEHVENFWKSMKPGGLGGHGGSSYFTIR